MSATNSVARKYDPKKPMKAVFAALSTAVLVVLRDYFSGHNDVSWSGLLAALVSGVVTFLITYFTKNPTVVGEVVDRRDDPLN